MDCLVGSGSAHFSFQSIPDFLPTVFFKLPSMHKFFIEDLLFLLIKDFILSSLLLSVSQVLVETVSVGLLESPVHHRSLLLP